MVAWQARHWVEWWCWWPTVMKCVPGDHEWCEMSGGCPGTRAMMMRDGMWVMVGTGMVLHAPWCALMIAQDGMLRVQWHASHWMVQWNAMG